MSSRNILVLGAGNSQVDAIRYCHEKGDTVIGCSYTTKDNGIPLLDCFEQVDIKNIDGVVDLARRHQADVIYSVGSDLAIPTAMKASEILGLPHFIPFEAAEICHAKHRFREALGHDFEGNLPFMVCSTVEEAVSYTNFPGMMKPVDSQGQRGCFRVDSRADILEHFEASLEYSVEGKVIIESFIDGPEISVNAYRQDGRTKFSIVSDRVVFDQFPGGLVKKHRLPTAYASSETEQEALDLADRIAAKLGIDHGPLYCQIKIGPDGKPYILEAAPRLDGCHMWNLIKHYTGADLLDACFRHLLDGESVLDGTFEPAAEAYELEFLCEKTGEHFDSSKYDLEGAEYARLYYKDGDRVYRVNGFYEKCGYVIRKVSEGESL